MGTGTSPVQRRILGAAALAMLIGAAVMWLWQPQPDSRLAFYWQGSLALCWRMGAVLAAAWLAYDDVQRIPGWLLLILPVLLIVLVRSSKLLLVLLLLLILGAILWRLLMPAGGRNRR